MKTKSIIAVILLIFILIIIFQNTEVVSFRFLFWQVSMSRIVWLLLVLLIGFVAGFVLRTTNGKSKPAGDKGKEENPRR